MMPVFRQTIKSVIPFLGREGIKKAHIWGVLYPFALGELLWVCDQYGIELSTDSVGPNWGPCMSKWGIGDWINRDYKSTQGPIMGIHRKIHVAITRCWLKQFRQSQYYREPPKDSHRSHKKAHNGQMSIFDLIEE